MLKSLLIGCCLVALSVAGDLIDNRYDGLMVYVDNEIDIADKEVDNFLDNLKASNLRGHNSIYWEFEVIHFFKGNYHFSEKISIVEKIKSENFGTFEVRLNYFKFS